VTNAGKPRRVSSLLVLLGVAVAITVLPAPALAGKSPKRTASGTTGFVKVATHPQAAAQPTATGKTIATLKAWNGKLYAGFGDYGANTGPITVNAFDGTSFASTLPRDQLPSCAQGIANPQACNADTEALYEYHNLSRGLYASSVDPRGSNPNYVFGTAGGPGLATWQNPAGFAEHAFDLATLTGSDLWVVGSKYGTGTEAAAWRSQDGGASWEESLSVGPIDPNLTCMGYPNFTRFYGAGVLNGKLYVTATDCSGGAQPASKVFNGTSWSDGPHLPTFNHAETFAGKMVFVPEMHSGIGGGALQAFDGTTVTNVGPTVTDYTIDGNTIYALGGGKVQKSQDLVNWTVVATAPSVARSIAVMNGSVYLGGTDSAIYRN
jgi:hypothetical protein